MLAWDEFKGFNFTDAVRDIVENYDPRVDRELYKTGIGLDLVTFGHFIIPGFLSKMELTDSVALVDKIAVLFEESIADFEGDKSNGNLGLVAELWIFLRSTWIPLYASLGLWSHGAAILKRLKMDKWNSAMFELIWNAAGDTWGGIYDGRRLPELQVNLWAFLFVGSDAASPEQVLSALQPPEEIIQLGQNHALRCYGSGSLMLPAALASHALATLRQPMVTHSGLVVDTPSMSSLALACLYLGAATAKTAQ